MQSIKSTFIYGFAIFVMFFGSGNLVFPLQIGQDSGGDWLLGFLGLFLTGILLPLIGLFVIKLHQGSYDKFFAEAGSLAKWVLPLFILSLLGAFGIVPRCITVAYGGIAYIYPEISLTAFSLIFCIACFFICLKDHFMIEMLGKWVTPVLLILLFFLIGLGILNTPDVPLVTPASGTFSHGFLVGYQTMDLFAAFFFSALIFKQIQNKMPEAANRNVIKAALVPSIIGASLLAVVYFGFVFLGAHYQDLTASVSPELILPTIAAALLGKYAALIIGIIILFSCLTTAVALNNIYARYLCTLTKVKDKHFPKVLLGTTAISFCISLLDFKGIANFLAPILEVTYPSLILLTFISILMRENKMFKITVFYVVLVFMLVQKYV
jgi:LIVCS family branched-chain amino acid:cation transporter